MNSDCELILYVVSNSDFQNYYKCNSNVRTDLATNIMKIEKKNNFSTSKCHGRTNVLYV